jgi:hypothetical protein
VNLDELQKFLVGMQYFDFFDHHDSVDRKVVAAGRVVELGMAASFPDFVDWFGNSYFVVDVLCLEGNFDFAEVCRNTYSVD